MTKANDLRDMNVEKLLGSLNDAREELMNLRFQQATGELTDFNRLKITRREIARILTILKEKQEADMEDES